MITDGIGVPHKTSTGTYKTINVDRAQNEHSHSITYILKPIEAYIVIYVHYSSPVICFRNDLLHFWEFAWLESGLVYELIIQMI